MGSGLGWGVIKQQVEWEGAREKVGGGSIMGREGGGRLCMLGHGASDGEGWHQGCNHQWKLCLV